MKDEIVSINKRLEELEQKIQDQSILREAACLHLDQLINDQDEAIKSFIDDIKPRMSSTIETIKKIVKGIDV